MDGSACLVYSSSHKGYVLGTIEEIQANGNTSVTVRSNTTMHHISDLRTAFERKDRVKVNLHIDKIGWHKYTGHVVKQVKTNTWAVRFEDDDQLINCDGKHMEHLAPNFVRVVNTDVVLNPVVVATKKMPKKMPKKMNLMCSPSSSSSSSFTHEEYSNLDSNVKQEKKTPKKSKQDKVWTVQCGCGKHFELVARPSPPNQSVPSSAPNGPSASSKASSAPSASPSTTEIYNTLVSTFIDHHKSCSSPSDLSRDILLALKENLKEWTIADETSYQVAKTTPAHPVGTVWSGDYEDCTIVGETDTTYDVKISSDGALCSGVLKMHVRGANTNNHHVESFRFQQRAYHTTLTTTREVIQFLNENPDVISSEHVQENIECPGCSKKCMDKTELINENAGLGRVSGHLRSCDQIKTRTNSYFCFMRAMGVPSFENFTYVAPKPGSRDRARIHYYKEYSFNTIQEVVHHVIQQAFDGVQSRMYKKTSPSKSKRKKRKRIESDEHDAACFECGHGGDLLCCDLCSLVFHTKCLPEDEIIPIEPLKWACPVCRKEKKEQQLAHSPSGGKEKKVEETRTEHPLAQSSAAKQPPTKKQKKTTKVTLIRSSEKSNSSSGFFGVKETSENSGKCICQFSQVYIGTFHNAFDAALAFDKTKVYLGSGDVRFNFTNYSQVPDPVLTSGQTLTSVLKEKFGSSNSSSASGFASASLSSSSSATSSSVSAAKKQTKISQVKLIRSSDMSSSSSGFFGVKGAPESGKFEAKISQGYIGTFHNAFDAALAFDKTKEYLGSEDVRFNFTNYSQVPDPVDTSGRTLTSTLKEKFGNSKSSSSSSVSVAKEQTKKKSFKLIRSSAVSTSLSGYVGVQIKDKAKGRYHPTCYFNFSQKMVGIGKFSNIIDAAVARDKVIEYFDGNASKNALNFTNSQEAPDPVSSTGQSLKDVITLVKAKIKLHSLQVPKKAQKAAPVAASSSASAAKEQTKKKSFKLIRSSSVATSSSGFVGVQVQGNSISCYFNYSQKKLNIGRYSNIIDAAVARDKVIEYFDGNVTKNALNFTNSQEAPDPVSYTGASLKVVITVVKAKIKSHSLQVPKKAQKAAPVAASSSNRPKKNVPPTTTMLSTTDARLRGWFYENKTNKTTNATYKSFKAPNGRRFNLKKEALHYAIQERSNKHQLDKQEQHEGWILNPIPQRIRIARRFGTKLMLGTVVGTLLNSEGMLFMNLHDDEDIETIDWPQLETGKVLYLEHMNGKSGKYQINDKIECKYRSSKGKFYRGIIQSYDPVENVYGVLYDDKEVDVGVKEIRLRRIAGGTQ